MHHKHVHCGGILTFSREVNETVKTKRGFKTIRKSLYLCDKCGEEVNCLIFPAYNEMFK